MTCYTGAPISFAPTVLSVLEAAGSSDPQRRSHGLRDFVEQYSPPLVAHLVRRRLCTRDEAPDFVHEFLLQKLIQAPVPNPFVHQFLARKSQSQGLRFRAYLVASLNNFVVDQKRRPKLTVQNCAMSENDEFSQEPEFADPFEADWAVNLLNRAIKLVESECRESDELLVWEIFNRRVLTPACTGEKPPAYARLVVELGLRSAKVACNRLQTGIRKFQRVLFDLVDGYLPPSDEQDRESQIREEIADLRRVLHRRRDLALDVLSLESCAVAPSTAAADELLELGDAEVVWQKKDDFNALWLHFLLLPIDEFLEARSCVPSAFLTTETPFACQLVRTLGEVIRHARPPLDLLTALKNDAKACLQNRSQERFLPRPLYHALYTLAIAIARVRLGVQITRYPDDRVRSYLTRALDQSWLDADSRRVLELCLRQTTPTL